MAVTRSCLSTMEKSCFRITTSLESATSLYAQNTHRHTGRLASLASRHYGPDAPWGLSRLRHGAVDNIIGALGHNDRVREFFLWGLSNRQLEQVLSSAAMQVPFPELIDVQLSLQPSSRGETMTLPDSFLGGSAPRLQRFSIPYPGLPNLLLSATHLVDLWLTDIPPSGYISPEALSEAMVASLSVLSSLKRLRLEFLSPQSRPDWESRRLAPPKRSIPPFCFQKHF
jgi:hypothetical protein